MYSSEFVALEEISVSSEFHAQYGSEVHMHIGSVHLPCNNYQNFKYVSDEQYFTNAFNEITNEYTSLNNGPASSITVYPNPTKGSFSLIAVDEDEVIEEFTVFDIVGRELFHSVVNGADVNVDIQAYPVGVYIVWTRTRHNNCFIKVLKVK